MVRCTQTGGGSVDKVKSYLPHIIQYINYSSNFFTPPLPDRANLCFFYASLTLSIITNVGMKTSHWKMW